MKFNRFYNAEMMNEQSASAPCANANTSCAQSASANNSMIAVILDAMFVASIIICAIISISILGLLAILAILVLVRLITNSIPLWQCEHAI